MGQWRVVISPRLEIDTHDPQTALLLQWITGRLIPDLKRLPFDFVIEIHPADEEIHPADEEP